MNEEAFGNFVIWRHEAADFELLLVETIRRKL